MPKFDYFLAYLPGTTTGRIRPRHLRCVNDHALRDFHPQANALSQTNVMAASLEIASRANFRTAAILFSACEARLAGVVKKGQPPA